MDSTVILLSQYRFKIGKAKYFTLMGIPLIYYLFPFESSFGNIFSAYQLSSPIGFGIVYVSTFSATKQVGALLFSLSFLTASTLVVKNAISRYLLLSAVGLVILFSTVEIGSLQYKIFPPFGLMTEAFIPLGAYLLLVGIFNSAMSVSKDVQLRKEFYKSATRQLDLLMSIGVSQMEKELEAKAEYAHKLVSDAVETPVDTQLNQQEVKKILREVLDEVYNNEKSKLVK